MCVIIIVLVMIINDTVSSIKIDATQYIEDYLFMLSNFHLNFYTRMCILTKILTSH